MADQYRDVTSSRTVEATLGLTKNTFFAGAHSGAFYYIINNLTPGTPAFTTACIARVLGAMLWFASAYRTHRMMSSWNDFLSEIERADPEYLVEVYSNPTFEEIEDARITGTRVFFAIIWLTTAMWFSFVIYSILKVPWLGLVK